MAKSKMTTCKVCGKEIAKNAKVCPYCGAKHKRPIKTLLTIVLVFFALLVVISVFGSGSGDVKQPDLSKEDYISQCAAVSYEEVARNPDSFKGQLVTFKGKVIQVMDGSTLTLRINQENSEDQWASDTWYVRYKPAEGESRILEGDELTVYGICNGTISYTAVLGNKITVPSLSMAYYEN